MLFIPRSIRYSDSGYILLAIFGIQFLLIPFILYKTFEAYKYESNWSFILVLASSVIGITSWLARNDYVIKHDLMQEGIWTKSVVKDKYLAKGKHNYGWRLRLAYTVGSEEYKTTLSIDYTDTHQIGDTVSIIYLRDYPSICEADFEWHKK
jgi:hypothetical protein